MLQVGVATGRLVTRGLEQGRKYTVNAEVTNQLGSSHQSTNGSWINNGVCTMIMVAMYQAVGILYAPSFPAMGLTLVPSRGINPFSWPWEHGNSRRHLLIGYYALDYSL